MKIGRIISIFIVLDLVLLGAGFFLGSSADKPLETNAGQSSLAHSASEGTAFSGAERRQPVHNAEFGGGEYIPAESRDRHGADRSVNRETARESRNSLASGGVLPGQGGNQDTGVNQAVESAAGQPASGVYNAQQQSGDTPRTNILTQNSGPDEAAQSKPVKVPLAFTDPAATLNLNEGQQQQLANLQQDFINSVGGGNQNPNDPAYSAQWRAAQEYSDAMFKMTFGIQAFLLQQMNQNHNQGD